MSLSSKISPHSGQNFGGCAGSSGSSRTCRSDRAERPRASLRRSSSRICPCWQCRRSKPSPRYPWAWVRRTRAELAGVDGAAGAFPAVCRGFSRLLSRCLLRCRLLSLLLLTHGEQVLSVHSVAGVHRHAHAHKAGHCACLVAGRGLHGVRLSADKGCRRHGGIAHDSCTLSLLDELRILFGESDRAEGNADDLESAQFAPLCGEGGVHSVFKVGIVSYYLIGTKLQVGELSKAGWSALMNSVLSWLSISSRVYSCSTLPQTLV